MVRKASQSGSNTSKSETISASTLTHPVGVEEESADTTSSLISPSQRPIAFVKWFNNKTGYGFLRDKDGNDIFVHHQNIVVKNKQYKYLVTGEYVEYDLQLTPENNHKSQAVDVTGIYRGNLMCETRFEIKIEQNEFEEDEQEYKHSYRPPPPPTTPPRRQLFTEQFGAPIPRRLSRHSPSFHEPVGPVGGVQTRLRVGNVAKWNCKPKVENAAASSM